MVGPRRFERPHLQRAAQLARAERQAPPRLEERQPGDAERAIDRGPPRRSRPQKHVEHHPQRARDEPRRRRHRRRQASACGALHRSSRTETPPRPVADPRRREPLARTRLTFVPGGPHFIYTFFSFEGGWTTYLRSSHARRDERDDETRPEIRFALFDIKCVRTRVLPLAREAAGDPPPAAAIVAVRKCLRPPQKIRRSRRLGFSAARAPLPVPPLPQSFL